MSALTTTWFIILWVYPFVLVGDTIELKNGDLVDGTFKQATDAGAVIEVGGQPVTIPLDKVRAIYFGSHVEATKTPRKVVTAAAGPAIGPAVTLEQFTRIKPRMTYKQVVSIIGSPGVESVSDAEVGILTVGYMWKNPDGSNMSAMFQNGRLINKAQFGLK